MYCEKCGWAEPTNGKLVQTSGSGPATAATYRSACVTQAGACIVHALALAFEAFVALGGCFFRGAAVVGDLADTLAGFSVWVLFWSLALRLAQVSAG